MAYPPEALHPLQSPKCFRLRRLHVVLLGGDLAFLARCLSRGSRPPSSSLLCRHAVSALLAMISGKHIRIYLRLAPAAQTSWCMFNISLLGHGAYHSCHKFDVPSLLAVSHCGHCSDTCINVRLVCSMFVDHVLQSWFLVCCFLLIVLGSVPPSLLPLCAGASSPLPPLIAGWGVRPYFLFQVHELFPADFAGILN